MNQAIRYRRPITALALFLGVCSLAGCGVEPNTEITVSDTSTSEAAPDISLPKGDWPGWRGPNGDGRVLDANGPTNWDSEKNVVWKASIPGRGHASPTVVGDKVFVATAIDEDERQIVICLDRKTGKQLWEQDIHSGSFVERGHHKSTNASSTVACDGNSIFVSFLNGNAIWLTALDLEGKQRWQTNAGNFKAKFGYSASPVILDDMIIVAGDNRGSGFLAAVHRGSGDIVWRKQRPSMATYASPAVHTFDGKKQILIAGNEIVASYDPKTGDENWQVSATTEACVGTIVASDKLVFASGGYPGSETAAIDAKTGKVAWRIDQKAYVPSLLYHDGHLYLVDDNGKAYCWKADSGEVAWRHRMGGNFSASATLAGDKIYVISETGLATVFRATPKQYEEISQNQLGDESFATPVVADNQLFLRIADSSSGKRLETVYCIAEPQPSKPEEEPAKTETETGE